MTRTTYKIALSGTVHGLKNRSLRYLQLVQSSFLFGWQLISKSGELLQKPSEDLDREGLTFQLGLSLKVPYHFILLMVALILCTAQHSKVIDHPVTTRGTSTSKTIADANFHATRTQNRDLIETLRSQTK